jgi:hypothetical protein
MTERTCHHLVAEDAVVLVPPDRYLRGLEADFAYVAEELERRSKRKRGPAAFKQADVTRAVKGVQATGAPVGKVEVSKDKITVEVGKGEAEQPQKDNLTPLEAWRRKRHAR